MISRHLILQMWSPGHAPFWSGDLATAMRRRVSGRPVDWRSHSTRSRLQKLLVPLICVDLHGWRTLWPYCPGPGETPAMPADRILDLWKSHITTITFNLLKP